MPFAVRNSSAWVQLTNNVLHLWSMSKFKLAFRRKSVLVCRITAQQKNLVTPLPPGIRTRNAGFRVGNSAKAEDHDDAVAVVVLVVVAAVAVAAIGAVAAETRLREEKMGV